MTASRTLADILNGREEILARFKAALDALDDQETTPIFDALKAEFARNRRADELLADSEDPCLTWWQRGSLRRQARNMRGGVA